MSEFDPSMRDARGNWRPALPITLAPVNHWPLDGKKITRWLFGWPGFLWPYNAFWLLIAVVTWAFLTPDLATMRELEAWWVGLVALRNAGLVALLYGGLHLHLYVIRGQGDDFRFTSRPFPSSNRRFRFNHQVRDNVFHTLVFGVPVFTAYEVLTYWGFANGWLGHGMVDGSGPGYRAWLVVLVLAAPFIHSAHFYFGHRLLHTRALYRRFHALHHHNVEVGPWSGLSMHPVEHAIYFSTVVVQWLLALHPVNALYQIQLAAFLPALSHSGFDRVRLGGSFALDGGNYFHYLHHKHFECNYGGSLIPLDRLFGTYHDGTVAADAAMKARIRARRDAVGAT